MSPRAAWRLESLGFRDVYEYAPGKQDWITAGLPTERSADAPRAGDVARDDVPTCGLSDSLSEVRTRVRKAGFDTCIVVNEERVLFGILRSRQLEDTDAESVQDVMRPGPSTFRPNVDVGDLARLMAKHNLPDLPITTNEGVLVGLLLRQDAERFAGAERDHEH